MFKFKNKKIEKGVKYVKVNDKSIWCFSHFTSFSSFSIADFKQVDFSCGKCNTSCWNLKIKGLRKKKCQAFSYLLRFWNISFYTKLFPVFYVKRRYWIQLMIKGTSKFPHTLLWLFMIATRVCLSHFEKTFIPEIQTGQI